ncbi:MAG: HAD family hydrolase [Lachnospiraceae bacterium]|nr:HAD family hydrolase [Lachnospiraceae bacterium]
MIKKEQIDGIILDVDGTLWNSTGIVAKAWTRAVRENGCPERTVTPQMLQALFGRTMDVIAAHLLPDLTVEHRSRIMDFCCVYEQQELAADECRICYPGVEETIRELSGVLPLFIVSNCQKGYIELFLEKTGLAPFVKDIECYGNTGKGKSDNIRLLMERNGLKSPVYVGDTQGDADAAKEAGIPMIFAKYGFGTVDHAEAEISTFPELKEMFG